MVPWTSISMAIALAVFDGVWRLFVSSEPPASLLASAGNLAQDLRHLLPIPKEATLGGFVIRLNHRSVALTVINGALGYLVWFVDGISKSGWRLPRMVNPAPLVIYA